MGTNYYAVRNRPTTRKPIHIGKSSGGRKFLFAAQRDIWGDPPLEWNTYNQVRDWLKKHTVDSKEFVIMDEYDDVISFDDFFAMVERKQKEEGNQEEFLYCRNVDGYRFEDGEFW